MIIEKDYGYLTGIDKIAIKQDVAQLAVYSFRLDRYVSAKKKAATARMSEEELDTKLNSPEWIEHCEQLSRKISEQNTAVLDELEKAGLILGQYHPTPSQSYYDLWFWCNTNKNGRQLDYVTLTINDELPLEQQQKIIELGMAVFEKTQTTENRAIVQYKAVYDEQKLTEIAEKFAEENLGKFIRHSYYIGKIVKINPELNGGYKYAFKRKNAKTKGYLLNASELYTISLENATN